MFVRYRPTVLKVNTSNIAHNIRELKNYAGNARLMAVVKADALGHGAVNIAEIALENGVSWLGVASIEEGIELRNAGIKAPILIFGGIFPEQIIVCMQYDLDFTISDDNFIRRIKQSGIVFEKEVYAHLKIDTGMHRLGVTPKNLLAVLKEAKEVRNINLRGIWSHFSESASPNKKISQEQIALFKKCVVEAERFLGFEIQLKHMANSSGIINHKESHFNMVRAGLGLYGYYDDLNLSKFIQLKPAITWLTKIISLRDVPKGDPIGYGGTYITKRNTKIATVPVGYADGFNRLLSNKGQVLIKGTRVNIIGGICMDQAMLDVTDVKDVIEGEEVVILGRQLDEEISIYEMANLIGSIPNDVLVSIKNRVPREYYND